MIPSVAPRRIPIYLLFVSFSCVRSCCSRQVEFETLSYSVEIPIDTGEVPSMATMFSHLDPHKLFKKCPTRTLNVLNRCSGTLQPGTQTLVSE